MSVETQSLWPRRLAVLAMVMAFLGPFFFHLLNIPDYGRMQRDDYYGVLPQLADDEGFRDTPATYFEARINGEHRVSLPALIWRLNVAWMHGDNRSTALLALFFLGAVAWIFLRHASWGNPPERWAWIAVPSALLLLNPSLSYSLAKSFGGIHSFLADLLCLSAMGIYASDSRWRLPGAVLFGLLGMLTFSSSLGLWPALLVAAGWLGRSRRQVLGILVGGGIAALLFLQGWRGSQGAMPGPWRTLEFLASFLGGWSGGEGPLALWAGGLGLAGAALSVGFVFGGGSDLRRTTVFPVMVLVYVLVNALLAALGRQHLGIEQATAARYGLFPTLYWSSLSVVAVAALGQWRWSVRLAGLAMVPWIVSSYSAGLASTQELRDRAQLQRVAETELRLGCWESETFSLSVSQNPKGVVSKSRRDLLRRLGHVPFDRPREEAEGHVDAVGSPHRSGDVEGYLTDLQATSCPNVIRVQGWVERGRGIESVAFRYPNGEVRSIVHLWPDPERSERLIWVGLVGWRDGHLEWRPYALDGSGQAHGLRISMVASRRFRALAKARAEGSGDGPPLPAERPDESD